MLEIKIASRGDFGTVFDSQPAPGCWFTLSKLRMFWMLSSNPQPPSHRLTPA